MFKNYLFAVLLFHGVLSDGPDECIRYYFEDYDAFFSNDLRCGTTTLWKLGTYVNSTIAAPNEQSKWFIKASPFQVCTASIPFIIMPDYHVEANVYIEPIEFAEFWIEMFQLTEAGIHNPLKWGRQIEGTGWQVIRATYISNEFIGHPPYQGYVRLMSIVSEDSVMIVDSIRYIPSSMDPETKCVLYEDLTTTSSTTNTTTTITSTTTPTTTSTTTPMTTTPTTTTTNSPTTPKTTPSTTLTTIPTTITPTTAPTTKPETTTPTTTSTKITIADQTTTPPTTSTTTPPKKLTNSFVVELLDFRKSIRISKKRLTKVVNVNGIEQPPFELE